MKKFLAGIVLAVAVIYALAKLAKAIEELDEALALEEMTDYE